MCLTEATACAKALWWDEFARLEELEGACGADVGWREGSGEALEGGVSRGLGAEIWFGFWGSLWQLGGGHPQGNLTGRSRATFVQSPSVSVCLYVSAYV